MLDRRNAWWCEIDRPALPTKGRLRVELRLRAGTAETVYRCGRDRETSLPEKSLWTLFEVGREKGAPCFL